MKLKKLASKIFCGKGAGLIAAFALVVTTLSANSTCVFFMHQPKLPEQATKLRKF